MVFAAAIGSTFYNEPQSKTVKFPIEELVFHSDKGLNPCMSSSLAPDPIRVQSCICCLF